MFRSHPQERESGTEVLGKVGRIRVYIDGSVIVIRTFRQTASSVFLYLLDLFLGSIDFRSQHLVESRGAHF